MSAREKLYEHLKSGATTTCHAWKITRSDGLVLGFTDHDEDITFDGLTFKANSGLSAGMIQKSTGPAVSNTEAIGALSSDAITEIDLRSGRFDGAKVVIWLLNWREASERVVRFRGTFGEIKISEGEFRVELRGLTDGLDKKPGSLYQPNCPAVLGDASCKVDLNSATYMVETAIKDFDEKGNIFVPFQQSYPSSWFEWGLATIVSGRAAGLRAAIRKDSQETEQRSITLMSRFEIEPQVGDLIRLQAGCDKIGRTCREKFSNFLNFRGFPHVPGSDWVASYPVASQRNDGGSRYK